MHASHFVRALLVAALAAGLAAQAQSMAYGDGFAIVGIVFWVGILPALWMRAKH